MTDRFLFKPIRLIAIALLGLTITVSGCDNHAENGAGHDEHDDHAAPQVQTVAAHSHAEPGETCFICDPDKRDKGRLWCNEHARYEDRCWLCHPELQDKDRLYCTEHHLYEDECFLCHPELADEEKAATASPADPSTPDGRARGAVESGEVGLAQDDVLFCNEHGVPEIECGICQPQLAKSLEPGGSLKVRMPSAESAGLAGIRTDRPGVSDAAPGVKAFCEAQYNLNALAKVTPLAGGVIRKVHHDIGDRVAKDDVLIELHSAQVATAKSDFLSAIVGLDIRNKSLERQKRLMEQNIGTQMDFQEAEASHRAAQLALNNHRQTLINLGFTEEEVRDIEASQDTSARLVVRAPFDGTLVERSAVVGESVEVGEALFTITDLSTRWLILSIPSKHISRIHTGQVVEASFDELPGVTIAGKVTWVDTSVDPRSRMVRARALVREGADLIRTGLFGEARVVTGESKPATVVPRDSVQRHEGGTFVFVQNEPDLFAFRRVALGDTAGDRVQVLAGLDQNDAVVTDGSFIMMSEFLKSRLGAGCADH